MIYVGLDLHKEFSVLSVMSEKGEVLRERKLPNNGEIKQFLHQFQEPVEVAMEASRGWYWLYDLLEQDGISVNLSHPLKTKAIASARMKTDKIDARMLAHLLRTDLLPLSYVPQREIRMKRELLRYRAALVRIQGGIKNRIHSILAKNNISHDFTDLFGKAGIAFLHSLTLPEVHRLAVEGYISVLEQTRAEIDKVSKLVKTTATEDAEATLLMSIPGISYYSALLIRSEIGDIKRFPSAKQLCSYAGLVPSTYASGNRMYHGHITKQGSRWLRWILIEAVIHSLYKPGPLHDFYHRLERRKGSKIARVATARKLLEWIYHMLKEGKTYRQMENWANNQR